MVREPEWDDIERDKMLALAQYDRELCDCGMHISVADTDPDLEMVERICPVCAGVARNMRIYVDTDKKATDVKAPPEASRPTDGRHLSLRPKTAYPSREST